MRKCFWFTVAVGVFRRGGSQKLAPVTECDRGGRSVVLNPFTRASGGFRAGVIRIRPTGSKLELRRALAIGPLQPLRDDAFAKRRRCIPGRFLCRIVPSSLVDCVTGVRLPATDTGSDGLFGGGVFLADSLRRGFDAVRGLERFDLLSQVRNTRTVLVARIISARGKASLELVTQVRQLSQSVLRMFGSSAVCPPLPVGEGVGFSRRVRGGRTDPKRSRTVKLLVRAKRRPLIRRSAAPSPTGRRGQIPIRRLPQHALR